VNKHSLNRQKAFAIIIGQCTQRLQDKMHDDPQWDTVNKGQKPLELYSLIERVVMKQTGDEYQPTNLVDNLLAVLLLKQPNNMSNAQWYEKFNTRVDVAESVGVEFDVFKSMWDYCIENRGWNEYDTLTTDEQKQIRAESKERLFAYLLIKNSSSTSTHDTVRNNLQEAFIAKRDEYPTTRSDAIGLLNKYDDKKVPTTVASEGTAFAQKGKKAAATTDKKGNKNEDEGEEEPKKNPYANKDCFVCGKKGHGARKCPEKIKKDTDDSSTSSGKSSKKSINEFEKKLKNVNKQFAQLKAAIEEEESVSSDDDQSHFQFINILEGKMAPDSNLVLKQSKGKLSDLNLRKVILLDNQSTMSLFCNKSLVSNIRDSEEPLTLQSNGGSMKVHQIADIGSGQSPVWF
jgi:hypothetical protein